ncbi:alpha/beta fold hydrolase [Nonomuraea sp. CA-141351]|uniref:alpha/beta fold hydrolase n=1 Tax=Nonomuraea sp. CA-141351 TaxID=3239996 RepID=UPI003D933A33
MRAGVALHGTINLAYQVDGPPDGEPLLLLAGTGMPLAWWPDDFCTALAEHGFAVARMDNRDTGTSTHLTAAGVPRLAAMLLRPAQAAPYRLEDMADDAAVVLDALGWRDAHLVGHSLGAMIAQTLAIRHPSRLRTLTSISGTPSPRTTLRLIQARRATPRTDTAEALADRLLAAARIYASPAYPLEEAWYAELTRLIGRRGGLDPAGARRHNAAILASGDRRPAPRPDPRARAHAGAARPGQPAHHTRRRPRYRRRHSRRPTAHLPRHGPRSAPAALAGHHRGHPHPGRRRPCLDRA